MPCRSVSPTSPALRARSCGRRKVRHAAADRQPRPQDTQLDLNSVERLGYTIAVLLLVAWFARAWWVRRRRERDHAAEEEAGLRRGAEAVAARGASAGRMRTGEAEWIVRWLQGAAAPPPL